MSVDSSSSDGEPKAVDATGEGITRHASSRDVAKVGTMRKVIISKH